MADAALAAAAASMRSGAAVGAVRLALTVPRRALNRRPGAAVKGAAAALQAGAPAADYLSNSAVSRCNTCVCVVAPFQAAAGSTDAT